jgi:hypothetical protein
MVLWLLALVENAFGSCDATTLAGCQTEDVMKCDQPCVCMVKYGECMRDAGCEWDMYKEYINACHRESDTACVAEILEIGPDPIDIISSQEHTLLEAPVVLPAKYGQQGSVQIPAIHANSTDNVEEIVAKVIAEHNASVPLGAEAYIAAQLKKKLAAAASTKHTIKTGAGNSYVKVNQKERSAKNRFAGSREMLAIAHSYADHYVNARPFPHIGEPCSIRVCTFPFLFSISLYVFILTPTRTQG